MKTHLFLILILIIVVSCKQSQKANNQLTIDQQLEDYYKKFPYQDTYNYMIAYTGGDASKLNTWVIGQKPELVKAGNDKVVRMNNDTYYKVSFLDLSKGPVLLKSKFHTTDRFYSFQLMNDQNVNFNNVYHPKGTYSLYFGDKPENIEGEAIESPSKMAVVIVRVEVKHKFNVEDTKQAAAIFNGITVNGPSIKEMPNLDLLSHFSDSLVNIVNQKFDSVIQNISLADMFVSNNYVPTPALPLYFATWTKMAWGGPVPEHSTYEGRFTDVNGDLMRGANGIYTLTTDEPPVKAFWSVTVYDSDRGGFLHPNKEDRYNINGANAIKNENGTITFIFKTKCEESDINCLEVPDGVFDVSERYYLPHEQLITGEWKFPHPELMSK